MSQREKTAPFEADGRLPLVFIFTLLLQVAGAVWWASAVEAQNHFRDVQLQELQRSRLGDNDKQEQVLQRLTRLEAQSEAAMSILQRLDAQTGRRR